MNILAHRGYWKNEAEKNSEVAIKRALAHGFGFESDVRDAYERLVISHNIPSGELLDIENVLSCLEHKNESCCFAINIKADGLLEQLKQQLTHYNITNYFLFDMSIPQMIEYKEAEMRYFTRQSEIEMEPSLYENAAGVWIDGFFSTDWITEELIKKHISDGKTVCIVSPELHGRNNHNEFWEKLKRYDIDSSEVMLCTDYPIDAKEFFYGKQD